MPKLTIAGRELEVRPATLGFLKKQLRPWRQKYVDTFTEEQAEAWFAEGVALYLGEQVDVAWLDANVVDPAKFLRALAAAAGMTGASGEVASP